MNFVIYFEENGGFSPKNWRKIRILFFSIFGKLKIADQLILGEGV